MEKSRTFMISCMIACAAALLMAIPETVQAQLFSKKVTVAEILSDPARYDQKEVTVTGYAFIVRKKKDRARRPWMLISFCDQKDRKKVINVFGPGHPDARNGDIVKVTGKFKAKSKRGRYTYKNEIETTSKKVVVIAKGTAPNR